MKEFPELRRLRRVIETGPLGLRDALDAAFTAVDGGPAVGDAHMEILRDHTGGWFGAADEVRALLATLELTRLTCKLSSELGIPCQDFSRELAQRIRRGGVRETGDVLRWLALYSVLSA